MFSTVKELHIYLEQRIQQATANRHRSIDPELFDMVLNSTIPEYLESKADFKNNGSTQGFEQTKRRTDEFRSIKKNTGQRQLIYESEKKGYVLLPADYYQFISARGTTLFSKFPEKLAISGNTNYRYTVLSLAGLNYINGNNVTGNIEATFQIIVTPNSEQKILTIDVAKFIPLITFYDSTDEVDKYEFVKVIQDTLTKYGVEMYWEYFDGAYYQDSFIVSYNRDRVQVNPFITINGESFNLGLNSTYLDNPIRTLVNPNAIVANTNEYDFDLQSSEDVMTSDVNYYCSSNRHYSPLCEVIGDRLYCYMDTTFRIDWVNFTYYKRPYRYNFNAGLMSDLTITNDFIEMVVTKLLLILKDEVYQYVKQTNNNH